MLKVLIHINIFQAIGIDLQKAILICILNNNNNNNNNNKLLNTEMKGYSF